MEEWYRHGVGQAFRAWSSVHLDPARFGRLDCVWYLTPSRPEDLWKNGTSSTSILALPLSTGTMLLGLQTGLRREPALDRPKAH